MRYHEIAQQLKAAGVENAAFEAAELIKFFEKVSPLLARTEDFNSEKLKCAVEARLSGTPLQYILGEWDFMGLTFAVSPACLIPRADTELLCQYIVDNAPKGGIIADLCTGSGCIAIAALRLRPDLRAVAAELYPETLEIARKNARLHNVEDRIRFIKADVTEDCLEGSFDMIVSNPPYVSTEEMKQISKEVAMEPPHALTDGGDGLSIIRRIIELYPKRLKKRAVLAIEIGWKQGEAVLSICQELGLDGSILKDIEGRDRVVLISKP